MMENMFSALVLALMLELLWFVVETSTSYVPAASPLASVYHLSW